jgi:outer membrane protein assembly factor BamB
MGAFFANNNFGITFGAAIVLVGVTFSSAPAQIGRKLLPRDEAARLGLTRAWFAQVQMDTARSRVERAILSGDQLFVLTTTGTLHAFNAHSGETDWVATFGNPDYPSLGPAANATHVALVNGSTLYVLSRVDGRATLVRQVGGPPGAAPALSGVYCFVPMVTGRVEGYPIAEGVDNTWFYLSQGRAMVAPLVTDVSVVWSTDAGHVYVGHATQPGVRYRIETGSEIVAPPAFRRPTIYVATVSGELLAVHETTGGELWRFTASDAIVRSPAAVGGRVFVTSSLPAMFAVDATSGMPLWAAPRVTQFAAAGRERVYAMDTVGGLVALDATSGKVLHRMPTDGSATPLVNDQTDRLYLVSNQGLVQCFHEIGAVEPLIHNPPLEASPPGAPGALPGVESTPAAVPPAQPATPPAEGENPFDTGAPRQPTENPFDFGAGADRAGTGGAAGGNTSGGGDNPFDR